MQGDPGHRPHTELARLLSDEAEADLADPSNPRTLDIALACTVAAYDAGNAYLRALQERAISARYGSTIGVMRASHYLAKARAVVEADTATGKRVGPQSLDKEDTIDAETPLPSAIGPFSSKAFDLHCGPFRFGDSHGDRHLDWENLSSLPAYFLRRGCKADL